MKIFKKVWICQAALLFSFNYSNAQPGNKPVLYSTPASTRILCYDQPAALWTEALPVGNGRLGGMIYGGTGEEVIKLNENSVWAGGPYNSNGKGGYASLDSIRKLVFDGKGKEAEQLFEKTMMARNWGTAPYQPVGNLKIVSPGQSFAENYRRELILDSAICRISYKIGKSRFTRTAFCSYPDQVMVIHIEASDSASINSLFSLEGVTNPQGTGDEKWGLNYEGDNILILSGVTKSFDSSDKRLRYECRMKVISEGGSMKIIHKNAEMAYCPAIEVKGAIGVTILITAASSYVNYKDVSGNPEERNRKIFDKLGKKTYNEILKDHVADFGSLFNRVSLDLIGENTSAVTTDKRFGLFASGKDRNFPALFFQYGRYLLISSSRDSGLPANLQGLWNQDINPAWNGGFTTNINFQMNYWSSDLCNLSECRVPQLKLIKEMHSTGTETARLNFGSDGWVFNCNTDIWLASAPIYGAYWGAWQGATAWFSNDLWDHFLFTQDTSYLREYYPLIRDAVIFYNNTLVKHPKYGWLVTNPSSSPENGVGGDPAWTRNPDGTRNMPIGICAGPTCDNAMISELFRHFIEASSIIGQDRKLRNAVSIKISQLSPYKIGRYGQLQEWLEDVDNPADHHRHTSHLWGLYPGTSIDPLKTPELAEAARVVLNHRGDESTGWAIAWRTNLWARLHEGERAFKLINRQLKLVDSPEYGAGPGGTYVNMMDAHPPFQIDGNFGGTAAIAEMLLQSQNGYLEFLPAVPDVWSSGKVTGLKARGAFIVNLDWENKKLTTAKVVSLKGLPCVIKSSDPIVVTCEGKNVKTARSGGTLCKFQTVSGKIYRIVNK